MSNPEQISQQIFALLKTLPTPADAAEALCLANVLLIEQQLILSPTIENVERCAGNMAGHIVDKWMRRH